MDFLQSRQLGKTELKVGPLGVAAGYGVPTDALEEAFEKGCNYFYWGSQRTDKMADAIRNICKRGKRDDLVVLLQSYSRSAYLMESFLHRGLKSLGLEYADILLLGWHNQMPSKRMVDKALALKERGQVRYLALSSHKRSAVVQMAKTGIFDIYHIRYNAAHRGAETDVFPLIDKQSKPGLVAYTATRWGQLLKPKKMPDGVEPLSASDCYRFALSHPDVDVCMCGPKNGEQMKQALQTLERGPLDAQEMERVHNIGDHIYHHSGWFF